MGNVVMPLWADCPPVTRLLCVVPPALSLLLMLVEASGLAWLVSATFTCNLQNVFHRFFLWTLFIGPFYEPLQSGMAFLMIIFTVYMAMVYFPSREKDLGSTAFAFWLLVMNALTNLVYLLAMFILSQCYRGSMWGVLYTYQNYQGIWPLVIICMTLQSLANPTGSTNFWGFVQIPNKWYPVCLVAFFCLLSGMQILWDFVAALAVGYLHDRLQLERLLPSKVRVSQWEQRFGASCCALTGATWVPATQTPGYDVETGDRRYATLGDFGRTGGQQLATIRSNTSQSAPSSSSTGGTGRGFQAFSGAGNRLGESGESEQRPLPVRQQLPPGQKQPQEEEMRLAPQPLGPPTIVDG